ncbi:hypothetical protein TSUD_100900 [Trifolium subterraneum]|uniref:Uncharacterized protein n=1 Tax=Trifolium subterraneum TaxID=3900 RepID=A0A2Z6NCR8_TRISU|nr:hypothetical protein TSUD_100900 [Trifolium subterraneum]
MAIHIRGMKIPFHYGHLNISLKVFDQILEEELMDDSLEEELLMSLRLENERRGQSHTSARRKHTKRRHT